MKQESQAVADKRSTADLDLSFSPLDALITEVSMLLLQKGAQPQTLPPLRKKIVFQFESSGGLSGPIKSERLLLLMCNWF